MRHLRASRPRWGTLPDGHAVPAARQPAGKRLLPMWLAGSSAGPARIPASEEKAAALDFLSIAALRAKKTRRIQFSTASF
jgi:hypothetical protein